jgi:hypothetical protein
MNEGNRKAHWENVYTTKSDDEVSWFQETGFAWSMPAGLNTRPRGVPTWPQRTDDRSSGK